MFNLPESWSSECLQDAVSLTGCCTHLSYLYTVHTHMVLQPPPRISTIPMCGYKHCYCMWLHIQFATLATLAACGISTAKAAAHKATDSSHLNNFTVEQELIRQQVRGLLTNTFEREGEQDYQQCSLPLAH